MLTLDPDISAPLPDALQQRVWPNMSGLVHDLRQPLSVIDACADYLNLVLPANDRRARQQLELLQQQVGEANRILHEALLQSHYADAAAKPAAAPGATSRPLTKAASAGVTY
jgi:signal transduction histidine kinase